LFSLSVLPFLSVSLCFFYLFLSLPKFHSLGPIWYFTSGPLTTFHKL
jgi:hypothetical protein